MTPVWLPSPHGIVPLAKDVTGTSDQDRFEVQQRALEDARLEYHLRRYDATADILRPLVLELASAGSERDDLLRASALVLQARVHWRRSVRARGNGDGALERQESERQSALFEDAVALFQRHTGAIGRQNRDGRLYTDYGIALQRLSHHEQALEALALARESGAAPPEAFAYQGMACFELGRFAEAIRVVERGLQLAPGDKTLLTTLAITFSAAGPQHRAQAVRGYCRAAVAAGREDDLLSAEELLAAALELEPHDPQALSMMVLLLRSRGQRQAGLDLLARTLERDPLDAWARGLAGLLLRDEGKEEEAAEQFRQVRVGADRDLAWTLIEHAMLLAKKSPSEASDLVKSAAALLGDDDPRVSQAYIQIEVQAAIAQLTPIVGQAADAGWKAAVRLFKTLRSAIDSKPMPEAGPSTPLLQDDRSGVELIRALDQGPPAEAETRLRELVRIQPELAWLHQGLARTLFHHGKLVEAQEAVEEGLRQHPDDAALLKLKATVLRARGDFDGATQILLRIVRSDPADDESLVELLHVLRGLGRFEDALVEVDRKLAADPGHVTALVEKAALLRSGTRSEEAAALLEDALRTGTGPVEKLAALQTELGRNKRRLDDYDEAESAFRAAMASDEPPPYDAACLLIGILVETAEYRGAADLAQATIVRLKELPEDSSARIGWCLGALGWALQCLGNADREAIEALRESLRTVSDNPHAQKNLGSLLLRSADEAEREEGRRLIEELTDPNAAPRLPPGLIGWCHFLLQSYEAAEHWLRASLDGAGDSVADDVIGARFDLALTLLAAKRRDAAREQFDAAIAASAKRRERRRRGLRHVALQDLAAADQDGRIEPESAEEFTTRLCEEMRIGTGAEAPTATA